ncbi:MULTISPECIES: hypothetical protein [Flavobacteriales]|uniref:Uncharacterized protein n=2 Tax=Capnocytophaga canimorsus TaxID=28188 RepID=F9YUI3_CAPCC|nr:MULTISPECIES: hypothetical protein [Flavobacteriales]AEK24220.1 Hypothetical protein Ccan_21040 [Capnocytophaga canimorsus Cc5]ATA77157.1 hypothetical protein CGC47_05960 [Capnocytophaga canimorsus]ATA93911.1 hypothetical protein CGC54_05975 [Capnocytophaga canimorsus]AYW37227.1 hypothetical protein D8L92_07935 [Capnocytophaga canimorsus]EKB61359.1 hypothetical protein HMPREF9700_00854 [Bergeyella zoohelcum CCUG 30536]
MSDKKTNEYGGLLKKNPKLGVLVLVLIGVGFLWYAFKTYNDLTLWEQEGGTRPMPRIFAFAYNIGGIWAVVSLMAVGGLFFFYQAYQAYNKLIKRQ